MKREQKWVVPRTSKIPDPRIAIAKQLAWTKPITNETEYSLPEPDHYNYAGLSSKIWDCPVIECQVFYWDKKLRAWWSVYYVPEEATSASVAILVDADSIFAISLALDILSSVPYLSDSYSCICKSAFW